MFSLFNAENLLQFIRTLLERILELVIKRKKFLEEMQSDSSFSKNFTDDSKKGRFDLGF